jgi:hypothetical protein
MREATLIISRAVIRRPVKVLSNLLQRENGCYTKITTSTESSRGSSGKRKFGTGITRNSRREKKLSYVESYGQTPSRLPGPNSWTKSLHFSTTCRVVSKRRTLSGIKKINTEKQIFSHLKLGKRKRLRRRKKMNSSLR